MDDSSYAYSSICSSIEILVHTGITFSGSELLPTKTPRPVPGRHRRRNKRNRQPCLEGCDNSGWFLPWFWVDWKVFRIKFSGWAVSSNFDSLYIAFLVGTTVCYLIQHHLCVCYISLAPSTIHSVIPTRHPLAPLCPSILRFLCPRLALSFAPHLLALLFIPGPNMVKHGEYEYLTQEERRLKEDRERKKYWKKWGPYLSE